METMNLKTVNGLHAMNKSTTEGGNYFSLY